MKRKYCPTSNEQLNVPMTKEQWAVVDFIGFEAETAFVYPFAVDFDDVTLDMVDSIVAGCHGHINDTDILYNECERILGVNKELKKELRIMTYKEFEAILKDRDLEWGQLAQEAWQAWTDAERERATIKDLEADVDDTLLSIEEMRLADVPDDKIFVAVLDDGYYLEHGDYPEEFDSDLAYTSFKFDTPEEFVAKWYELEDGAWYWVFDKGELFCSGAIDPNDLEIFEEHWDRSFDEPEEDIAETLPYLSQCADFNIIRHSFSGEMLEKIEENIRLWEETDLIQMNEETLELSHKNGEEIFPAAIAWYAGLSNTENFVADFGDIALPDCVVITASVLALDSDDIYEDEEELADIVSDYLSDEYGYCHKGFALEVIYNEFDEPSEVVVSHIQWDVDEDIDLDEKTSLLKEALEAYEYDVDAAIEDEFILKHADEIIYGYQNGVDTIDLDFWMQYEELFEEKMSYEEYVYVDKLFPGDPLEFIPDKLTKEESQVFADLKGALIEFRDGKDRVVDSIINDAKQKLADNEINGKDIKSKDINLGM